MITVIAGTNRADSMTLRTANLYIDLLKEMEIDGNLLSLENHPVWEKGTAMLELEKQYLIPADKFIFVLPEYNASFPGILKLMIDNSNIRKCWWHKKALLTGISDGRAGNLRGVDHLTNILNYLKVQVHYNKLILSHINAEIDQEGNMMRPETGTRMRQQVEEFIKF